MFARRFVAIGASAALHAVVLIGLIWLAGRVSHFAFLPDRAAPPSTIVVRVVESLPATPAGAAVESNTRNDAPDDLGIHLPEGASTFSLPGFTFDFGKVVNRAGSLFPFLTGRLSLEQLVAPRPRDGQRRLTNPFSTRSRADSAKPPLVLTDAGLQSVLDASWSRRDRWRAFQSVAELADTYDAHAGGLPRLLRGYAAQNGLQPYVDATVRDPRLWTQLGLAADHADFIDFIGKYASRNPSTKSTTELLFLLERLVQASDYAITVLLDTDPIEDLKWTRAANRDAYSAVVKIRDYYRAELDSRGLTSREAIRDYYDAARLAVLTTIVDTTPDAYRAGDAQFLIGAIHWTGNSPADAVRAWKEIVPHPDDVYVMAYSAILSEIRASPPDVRQINRVLDGEHGRWLVLSSDRLRRFGYRFDTF